MRLWQHFKLTSAISRLRRASPADLKRWISTLPVVAFAPPVLGAVDALCQTFPNTTRDAAQKVAAEFSADAHLHSEVESRMLRKRGRRMDWQEWHRFLYGAIRIMCPRVVFETGVFDGHSSSVILAAMARNAWGELVSIDLPAVDEIPDSTHRMQGGTSLPQGCDPGWLVPDYLRERYRLRLGDSKELLPSLLTQYGKVDVFLHDSLHTDEHQSFEYRTVWPHMVEGGLLLSDDIFWSTAFHRFAREKRVNYVNLHNFGAIRVGSQARQ